MPIHTLYVMHMRLVLFPGWRFQANNEIKVTLHHSTGHSMVHIHRHELRVKFNWSGCSGLVGTLCSGNHYCWMGSFSFHPVLLYLSGLLLELRDKLEKLWDKIW